MSTEKFVAERLLTIETRTRHDTSGSLEDIMGELVGAIGEETLYFLKFQGFAVAVFAFSLDADAIAYTGDRDDVIRAIKEWIAFQDARLSTEPRGERGQS